MNSNFTFLQSEWPDLYQYAAEAELTARWAPRTAGVYSRLALEAAVRWMYDHDSSLEKPYDTSLHCCTRSPSGILFRPPTGPT